MATLNILDNFELTAQGLSVSGKQGAADGAVSDPIALSVTGTYHHVTGVLPTAAIVTVFDDDDDVPADWDFLFLWSDVDIYIQIIGSGTNVIHKVKAFVPFTLSFDSILAAANTTPISGAAEPTLQDIDSIILGNYSGGSANYVFAVVD